MSRGSRTPGTVSTAPADRLATLPDGEPEFTLGWEAIRWAETMLRQPNGPRAGRPFRLTSDQMRFLLWWYAMDPADGRWIFRHGVRRLSKGSGKSPAAAVLALIEFCAPVRLARKDHRMPGGCVGKPVDMPWVQIAATAESRTLNTMRMVRAFAPKGSRVAVECQLDPGKTIYYKQPEGILQVITSSVAAAEGAEASLVVADETEMWRPGNGGTELFSTLQDNLAKSGNRMLETSNAWVPGKETVAEASWEAWLAQETGQIRDGAGQILYDARLAPPDTDMSDERSLRTSLEWIYGDCDWKRDPDTGELDLAPIMSRIWEPSARPSESKRKYLNWPTVDESAWTTPQAWSRLAVPRDVDPDEPIVLFFDGSKSDDTTALVACCVRDGYVFVPSKIDGTSTVWIPDAADPDDQVDVDDVDLAVEHVMASHRVVGFFGDVKEWEQSTQVVWPKRYRRRLKVWAVPSGKNPQPIAWDMRGHVSDFTRAAELVQAEIEAGEGFFHDGNPILAKHVANCHLAPNRWGVSVSKKSPKSPDKIDAAVCMIGARMVMRLAVAKGLDRGSRGGAKVVVLT